MILRLISKRGDRDVMKNCTSKNTAGNERRAAITVVKMFVDDTIETGS